MKLKIELVKQYIYLLFSLVFGLLVGIAFGYRYKEVNTPICDRKSASSDLEIDVEDKVCDIYVDLSGAVKKPGVYCLKDPSILLDLVKRGGGFSNLYAKRYVEQSVNLAQKLVSNTKIYVPYVDDVKCNYLGISSSSSSITTACISINSATKSQLDTLPRVGESVAQKIIDGRPYKSINDLLNVSGIGESMLEEMKSKVCL